MDVEKLERFRNRVTFITGGSKNAGKTTFLNYLLPRLRGRGDLAYLTIGVDGEKRDRVFGNEKPSVKTAEGDYILTAESMLNRSGALFEICHVFPWKTVLGPLMLLKTRRSGYIELVGPENNSQLTRILRFLREEQDIRTVLVDGAVNRVTQLAAGEDVAFYYVMTITPENRRTSLEKVRTLSLLNKIPEYIEENLITENQIMTLDGALTSSVLKEMSKNIQTVIAEDFTKVFLSFRELKLLKESVSLCFRRKFSIEGLVFNLSNVEKSSFINELTDFSITLPYIFNPYRMEIPVYE
jgi:hypothetical protein